MLLCPVPWNSIRSSISSVRLTFRNCVFFLRGEPRNDDTTQRTDHSVTKCIFKLQRATGMCSKLQREWLSRKKTNSAWCQMLHQNQLNVSVSWGMLSIGFPLWVSHRTSHCKLKYALHNIIIIKLQNLLLNLDNVLSTHNNTTVVYLQKNSHKSKFWILWMDLIGWSIVLSYSLATSLNS